MSLNNIFNFLNNVSHIPPIIENIIDYTDNDILTTYFRYNISLKLKKYIMKNDILVYGKVQSGKTNEIINIIYTHNCYKIILVIQNSIMVLNQYITRFNSCNLQVNVIDSNNTKINNGINIILNNKHRRKFLSNKNLKSFIFLFDEADLTCNYYNLSIGFKRYYITATPFNMKIPFDKIIHINEPFNYYGLDKLQIDYFDLDYSNVFNDFLNQPSGILLISHHILIEDMLNSALQLSLIYPNITFITLNSVVNKITNGSVKKLKKQSINKIIDSFNTTSHLVFISHRLSCRGLSYVNSSFTRNITHQILYLSNNISNNIQKLRICGIYKNNPTLKLYINSFDLFKKMLISI